MAAPNTRTVTASLPAVSGGIRYAPIGTALPTDESVAWNPAFKALGYANEDGIEPSRDVNVDKIKAWGGDIVAALKTEDSRSFTFTFLGEYDQDVLEFVYGAANVVTTAATATVGTKFAVTDKAYKPLNAILGFEMFYGGKKRRIIIPNADIVVTGERPYVESDLTGYEVTVEALKDATGNRVYDYKLNDNPTG